MPKNMNKDNFFRYQKLRLHNYGIFRGDIEFVFDHQRTIIVGAGGTGKTTIVQALAKMGHVPSKRKNIHAIPGTMEVTFETLGNSRLAQEYSDIIFLNGEDYASVLNGRGIFLLNSNAQVRQELKVLTRQYFLKMLRVKSSAAKAYEELQVTHMSAGERACLGLAHVFAIRKLFQVDLPLVLDSPYAPLDLRMTKGVIDFLKEQPCQQIILLSEHESVEEDAAAYRLPLTYTAFQDHDHV